MDSIDTIIINFNTDQMMLLNICLAFIMFGVALDMKLDDFKFLKTNPTKALIGLCSQLILLPILTFILIKIFNPPLSVALGMVLIATCPGGNMSNFFVAVSKANIALSITLTTIVTLGATFLTPLNFSIWSRFIPDVETIGKAITIDPIEMVFIIIQLILIPLIIGVFFSYKFPDLTNKIKRPVRTLSVLIFFSFIIFALVGNFENIKTYLHFVFFIVLVHNFCALLLGYSFSKLVGLSEYDSRAISMETGIQNTGLGLVLIFNFFDGLGGMALIAAWYGIWDLVSGYLLALYWGKKSNAPDYKL